METVDRLDQMQRLDILLRSDTNTPWWVVMVVQAVRDLLQENVSLQEDLDLLMDRLTVLEQTCTRLGNQYSELLYHLKSGDRLS